MEEKYVPYEKLSKQKQRERNLERRASWNGVKPVTVRIESKKAYNRKRTPKRNDDFPLGVCFFKGKEVLL